LATNSIRGHANRRVLDRVKNTGDIFLAWADRPWVVEGAQVRVAIVGFDNGSDATRVLDGKPVASIYSDLQGSRDLGASQPLAENVDLCLIGDQKGGMFDIDADTARTMLAAPLNPNGRPNSDVVRPWVNGLDLVRRPRGKWIIDFGVNMSEADASLYELPFQHVLKHVRPERMKNNRAAYRERWWIHHEPRPKLRAKLHGLARYIATPTVSRHRLFVWLANPTLPDKQLAVVAREDDYFLGVLHSRVHELWSLQMCTWLGVGNDPRYTPTSTFETFPFPWPPGQEPAEDSRVAVIAEAARKLHELRTAWLNPPGASAADLTKRTLTNLYTERPEWLKNLHVAVDAAVIAAYGWSATISDDEILERLLALNATRLPA
jgi:type II restriction/modification system DNA methylase subunit YeeA